MTEPAAAWLDPGRPVPDLRTEVPGPAAVMYATLPFSSIDSTLTATNSPSVIRFFNAPVFATFLFAMFWRRTTPWAGFSGLVAGFVGAVAWQYLIGPRIGYFYAGGDTSGEINAQMLNFYGAIVAFVTDAVVTVAVTLVTAPKPMEQLAGLVWGVPDPDAGDPHEGYVRRWWESPKLLGFTALGMVLVLSIIFI